VSATAEPRLADPAEPTAAGNSDAAARPDHSAFPALDGIRALAVAAIVGTHAAYWTYRYGRGPGSGMLTRLDSGVAVFFVLLTSMYGLGLAGQSIAAQLGRP